MNVLIYDDKFSSSTLINSILGQNATTSVTDFFATTNGSGTAANRSSSANNLVTLNGTGANGLPAGALVAGTNPHFDVAGLADNGGPTQTIALTASSTAALVNGVTGTGITTDQRGIARVSPPDIGAFEYTQAGPTISSISPTQGPETGGTTVMITGTNLDNATEVDFGATAVTSFTIDTATQITLTAPAGTGTVDVTVVTVGGTSTTSVADQFTYVPAPTVSGLSPTQSPETGGTTVMITGTNLDNATEVDFGATAVTSFTIDTATQITLTAPTGTGTVDVTVVTVGGTSATSADDHFTYYVAAPTVTAISPSTGPLAGGTVVTITGTHFTNAIAVDFNNTAATNATVDDDSHITASSPAGTVGIVDVTVTTVGGTSETSVVDQFTYAGTPTISISTATLALGSTTAGTAGPAKSYTVGGSDLTSDLVITAPADVELSDGGGLTWSTSLDLSPSSGTVISTTVEARISASATAGNISGNIMNTSIGAIERDVSVSATVKNASQADAIVASAPQT